MCEIESLCESARAKSRVCVCVCSNKKRESKCIRKGERVCVIDIVSKSKQERLLGCVGVRVRCIGCKRVIMCLSVCISACE